MSDLLKNHIVGFPTRRLINLLTSGKLSDHDFEKVVFEKGWIRIYGIRVETRFVNFHCVSLKIRNMRMFMISSIFN